MDEITSGMLDEFARHITETLKKVNASKGGEAEKLQNELSLFMGQRIPLLMERGLSVAEIQNAARAAADWVPNTCAPDAGMADNAPGEELVPPVGETVYFLPVEEKLIAAFAAGELDEKGFAGRLSGSRDITPLAMTEGLNLALTDFGKNPAMDDIAGGGEVVAGSDGEAFIDEYLDIRDEEAYEFSVCDPMVYKSAEEVRTIHGLLRQLTEKEFLKKANVGKLIKAGWFDGYDKRAVKKEADYIKQELWKEFTDLREVYRKAAEQLKGLAIFVGYD